MKTKMTKAIYATIMMLFFTASMFAQSVGINDNNSTPNSKAMLDVSSTSKGFLPPRMTYSQKIAIVSPPAGLIIWCSNCGTSGELQIYNGTTWVSLTTGTASGLPGAPTIGTATPGDAQASVPFIAPASNGGSTILSYTATSSPGNITGTLTQAGSGTITVTGLTNGTDYTFTVTATNATGTGAASAASNSVTPVAGPFVCGETLTDTRDSKGYTTMLIGSQCWMTENLAYLPSVVGPGTSSGTSPYYYVYGYDGTDIATAKATSNYQTYGVLYNWTAANSVCPTGWHLPTMTNWDDLTTYVNSQSGNLCNSTSTYIAKSLASTTNWSSSGNTCTPGNNPSANNATGFTVLPGGYTNTSSGGGFHNLQGFSYHWSSSSSTNVDNAMYKILSYGDPVTFTQEYSKGFGMNVRCLKD